MTCGPVTDLWWRWNTKNGTVLLLSKTPAKMLWVTGKGRCHPQSNSNALNVNCFRGFWFPTGGWIHRASQASSVEMWSGLHVTPFIRVNSQVVSNQLMGEKHFCLGTKPPKQKSLAPNVIQPIIMLGHVRALVWLKSKSLKTVLRRRLEKQDNFLM